jgi:hypothetical protein
MPYLRMLAHPDAIIRSSASAGCRSMARYQYQHFMRMLDVWNEIAPVVDTHLYVDIYLPLTLSAYLMRSIVMESSVLESHVAVGCFAGNHVSRGSGSHERLIFGCPTRDRHVPCHVAVPSVGSLWGRYQIRSLVRIQELGPGPPPISTYIRLWSLPKASGHNSP